MALPWLMRTFCRIRRHGCELHLKPALDLENPAKVRLEGGGHASTSVKELLQFVGVEHEGVTAEGQLIQRPFQQPLTLGTGGICFNQYEIEIAADRGCATPVDAEDPNLQERRLLLLLC